MSDPSVRVTVPALGTMAVSDVVARLRTAPRLEPYGDDVIALCAEFSKRLSRAARGMPELQALAFWMRRTELVKLREQYRGLLDDKVHLAPQGVVFHVPPANVDTIFVYSWLLSALAGNVNVVRLSSRQTPQTQLISQVLAEIFADAFPGLSASTMMVEYGHDDTVTAAISQVCDVRVIWGGDRSVRAIRKAALPVHAKELTFPDRFSLAAIATDSWHRIGDDERSQLVERFFNDAYWFDQLGCSSPRLVAWVGGSAEQAAQAAEGFYGTLQRIVRAKSYAVEASTAISKLTFAYGSALDHDLTARHQFGNEVTVLDLDEFSDVRGEFSGAGLFWSLHVDDLGALAERVRRTDQTLSHHGLTRAQLLEFAGALNGRGIDRMVPFGEALAFNRYWDGHDLLQSFLRRVWIDAPDA